MTEQQSQPEHDDDGDCCGGGDGGVYRVYAFAGATGWPHHDALAAGAVDWSDAVRTVGALVLGHLLVAADRPMRIAIATEDPDIVVILTIEPPTSRKDR